MGQKRRDHALRLLRPPILEDPQRAVQRGFGTLRISPVRETHAEPIQIHGLAQKVAGLAYRNQSAPSDPLRSAEPAGLPERLGVMAETLRECPCVATVNSFGRVPSNCKL